MKISHRKIVPLSLWLACLSAIPFCSADEFPLKAMDADSDGQVSREEHADGARENFKNMDLDHNDVITASELDEARKRLGDKRRISSEDLILQMDSNRDGELTLEEDEIGARLIFERADWDGNDKLDAAQSIVIP